MSKREGVRSCRRLGRMLVFTAAGIGSTGAASASAQAAEQHRAAAALGTATTAWHSVSWHPAANNDTDAARANRCASACAAHLRGLGPQMARLLGLNPTESVPSTRLEVHVYEDPSAWAAIERRLTKGRFAGNQAFSHHGTKSSHIALQPVVAHELLVERGPPRATLRVLAHEAAHLAVYHLCPGFRFHPSWLAEGIALQAARRPQIPWRSVSIRSRYDPDLGATLFRVQRLLATDRLPTVRSIVDDRLGALDFYARYAVQEWWFQFLTEEHPAALAKALAALPPMPARPDLPRRLRAELQAAIGPGWSEVETRFRSYCGRGTPAWEQPYRMLDTSSVPMLHVAFERHNALAWRTEPTPEGAYAIEVAGQIRPGRGRQMNVLLERSDGGFVSIATVAGHGLTVLRYRSDTNSWDRLASWSRPDGIVLDRLFEWRAELGAPTQVKGRMQRSLTIHARGQPVLTTTVPSSTRSPQCGLGVQARTAGEWVRFAVIAR